MEDNQFPIPAENGEPVTFNEVFNQLYPKLCFFAERLTSSKDDAEEIVSESFVKLWKRKDGFNNMSNIKAFLYITVKNNCLDYLRSNKTKKIRQKVFSLQQDLIAENNIELIELIELESEFIHQVYLEIEKLPEECKKVFKLTYLEELSRNEVASLLGITSNTVRNQNANAKRLLRIALNDKELILLLIILAS